ncbi:hypothetical protein [uncultured Sphingomonas sp.]|uniref:hypothetical protein n=1 Tax=uncultured Sphingomonas sp. TaxID=158754 RepID=UPI0035CB1AC1
MIGQFIAGLIGERIDSSDGEGGAVGAAVGVLTWEVAKRVVPAAIVLGSAALAARYISRKLKQSPSPSA